MAGAAMLAALASLEPAHAGLHVLHTFDLTDGANPAGVLVQDSAGNFYGTTLKGGSGGCYDGCGTLYKIAPDGTETVLYSFGSYATDGSEPTGLITDKAGNFYGTTAFGGGTACKGAGCGTVFKVTRDGSETILFAFPGGSGGAYPSHGVIEDKSGNFIGTTYEGGNDTGQECEGGGGCGVVYRLARDGTETVLYAFAGGSDGDGPGGGVIEDKAGNLYGTTYAGGSGCTYFGCGIVFKLAPDGTETVLYRFAGGTDGATPYAGLIRDAAGNLYGTTYGGGHGSCCGTVFELAADGTETLLHVFASGTDGDAPFAGLTRDRAGNFYGTTEGGGGAGCGGFGCGIIFEVAPDGTETVLHAFHNFQSHGYDPEGGLMLDNKAHLVGTTFNGGIRSCPGFSGRFGLVPGSHPRGCGIVFRLKR